MESYENHFWSFKPPLAWILLEFHLLHSQQEIVEILIMIFLGLLLYCSTSTDKDISNVAETFQSCQGFPSPLVLLDFVASMVSS